MRPFADIAVEELLEQLPKPQIEEIVEPEPMDTSSAPKENADTPMDTSGTVSKQEQGTYLRVRCLELQGQKLLMCRWKPRPQKALHRERHLS